ncbi:MAG TPA: nitroreductase family protein [Victivallales bacterium]|nr:nitroreductase family protein [Victivallales bacterium]
MLSLLKSRRSIRKYENRPVPKEVVETLIEAVLYTPSGKNTKPWEFIVIDDKNILSKLSESKTHGSKFLKNAPLGIVVAADETKTDTWIEDASVAAATLHYAAESLDLGSCWVQIHNRYTTEKIPSEKYVSELLNIPEHIRVIMILGIGFPDEKKSLHDPSKFNLNKIKYNNFNESYNFDN